jgi:hypothetical protein
MNFFLSPFQNLELGAFLADKILLFTEPSGKQGTGNIVG